MTLARFYLDEHVPYDICVELRQRGHDALDTNDVGRGGATDGAQLLYAAQDDRILVTYNGDDFTLLHDAWVRWFRAYSAAPWPVHAGILIIPHQQPRLGKWLPPWAATEIDWLVRQHQSLTNCLYRWTPTHRWVSYP